MKYLSIRVKLIIVTLITLIPLIILQSINIDEDFQRNSEQKLQASVELAHAISTSFYNSIEELWTQEAVIGAHITAKITDIKEIQSYLDTIVNTEGTNIQRLSWVSSDGTILANTRPYMIGQVLIERDYFKRIALGEDRVLSDLVQSYVDGAIVVPVARGIRKDGKLIGILVYSIDVNRLVTNIPDLKLHKGDVVSLIDKNGRIAYQSLNNNLSFEERQIPMAALEWKALKGEIVKIYKTMPKLTVLIEWE